MSEPVSGAALVTGGASGIGAATALASDESSYCTGAEFLIDGGMLAGPPPV